MQDAVKGGCNILDVEEVTGIRTVSVQGELLASHQLVCELGNQFLGELVGAVHIVTTSDQARELETAEVRLDQEFGTGLGGSVRVGGFENVFFGHGIGFKIFSLSVDLIGGNVNESLDGWAVFGALQKYVCSEDVGLGKCQ